MGKSDLKYSFLKAAHGHRYIHNNSVLNFPHVGYLQNVVPSSYKGVLVQGVHKIHVKFELVIIFLLNMRYSNFHNATENSLRT